MKLKNLSVLLLVICLSTLTGFGCGDDGKSGGNGGSNNTGDTGVEDVADNSNDAGDDTGGSSDSVIPTANSGAYASTTWQDPDATGTFYLSVIGFSDHPDVCSTIADTCDAQDEEADGTILAMQLLAGQQYRTGRYELGEFDEESFTADTMVATSQIDSLSSGGEEFDATSGHIDVTEFDAQHVAGTYELTIEGTVHTGSFDVDFCQALADDLAC
jgi:hypothetical protein